MLTRDQDQKTGVSSPSAAGARWQLPDWSGGQAIFARRPSLGLIQPPPWQNLTRIVTSPTPVLLCRGPLGLCLIAFVSPSLTPAYPIIFLSPHPPSY